MIPTSRLVPPRRRTSRPRVRLAFALLLGAALAGCATGTVVGAGAGVADSAAVVPEAPSEATLEVMNQSNYDVRVFIHYGGQYRRLGLVTSMRTAQFTLSAAALGREVRFLADPVGFSRRQRTDAIVVRPGDLVRLGLEKELRSHTLVY